MIMVDGLIYFDGSNAIASFTIIDTNIFVENNYFSEIGLIEHMAQSAALLTGYKHNSQNLPIKKGFIAALKNLKIESLPKVNQVVSTEVQITYEIATMTIVKLTTKENNTIFATAEMTLVLKENE
jgi:predicted hotdog family 3-hydroxylacyl-ACP dehydratase